MNRVGYDIEAVLDAPCAEESRSYPLYWILTSCVEEEDLNEFESSYVELQNFRQRHLEEGFCRYLDEDDFSEVISGLAGLRAVGGQVASSLAGEIEAALKQMGVMTSQGTFGSRPAGDEDEVDGIGFSLDQRFEERIQGVPLESEIYEFLQANKEKLKDFQHCDRIFVPSENGKGEVRQNPN